MKREINEATAKELMELVKAKQEIEKKMYDVKQEFIWEQDDKEAVKHYKKYRKLHKELLKAEDAIEDFIESF